MKGAKKFVEPGRIQLLLHPLALAAERNLADQHADLGLTRRAGHAPAHAGRDRGDEDCAGLQGSHHLTWNFFNKSPRSSGLVPSLPSLGSTITRTPRSASAILRPTRFSLPRPLEGDVLEPGPLRVRELHEQLPLGRLLALVEVGLRTQLLDLGASPLQLRFDRSLPLGDDRVALALLDGGLGLGLTQKHRLILDLPALDQLLILLVVDVAAHEHRLDPDAVRRHLVPQLIVRGLRLFDAQGPW